MTNYDSELDLMQFCRRLGWVRPAWFLRRLHGPVESKALVFEVGSSGNPYWCPFAFQVCYPEVDAAWDTSTEAHTVPAINFRARINVTLPFLARTMLLQKTRNRIRSQNLPLACLFCRSTNLDIGKARIHKTRCGLASIVNNFENIVQRFYATPST